MHTVLRATQEYAEHGAGELPFSPVVFGLSAFGALVAMLLVTYAFRSVGTRH